MTTVIFQTLFAFFLAVLLVQTVLAMDQPSSSSGSNRRAAALAKDAHINSIYDKVEEHIREGRKSADKVQQYFEDRGTFGRESDPFKEEAKHTLKSAHCDADQAEIYLKQAEEAAKRKWHN